MLIPPLHPVTPLHPSYLASHLLSPQTPVSLHPPPSALVQPMIHLSLVRSLSPCPRRRLDSVPTFSHSMVYFQTRQLSLAVWTPCCARPPSPRACRGILNVLHIACTDFSGLSTICFICFIKLSSAMVVRRGMAVYDNHRGDSPTHHGVRPSMMILQWLA